MKRDRIFYTTLGNIGKFYGGNIGIAMMGEVQFNVKWKTIERIDAIVMEMRKVMRNEGTYEEAEDLAQTILPLIEHNEYETARLLLFCHYMSVRNYFELVFDSNIWEKQVVAASRLDDQIMQHNIKKILLKILQDWQEIWFWRTDFSATDEEDDEN